MEQMEMYDEDVMLNIFFTSLQHQHPQLFDLASTKRWIICVPRNTSFGKTAFDECDFQNHILHQDSADQMDTWYHTVNGKNVSVSNNIITTADGFAEQRVVPILFEETFFNKNEESYQVLCINQPLEGHSLLGSNNFERNRVTLHYLTDCEDLLWKKRGDEKMGNSLNYLHQQYSVLYRTMKEYTFEKCLDLGRQFYQKGFSLLMKDKAIRKRYQSDNEYADSLKTALESFLFHKTYKQLFTCLCTSLATKDSRLNKITRNLRDLQLKDLDVRPEYCQNVPRGRKEMSNMSRYTTPLGKLICLRRVFRVLMQGRSQRSAIPLTTDDLLPIVVFIVVKADMPYWWATFRYMTSFRFSRSNNDDDLGFFLATLEAALEHIFSRQLMKDLHERQTQEQEQSVSPARPQSLWQQQDQLKHRCHLFFQLIRRNDLRGARQLIQERPSPQDNTAIELCHPLCDCIHCKQRLATQRQAREDLTVTVEDLDDRGLTALHVAAGCGHTHIIDWLISEGIDANFKDVQGQTPLHVACMKGKQNSTLLLLHHKSRPNIQDNEGNTALHLATLHGHEDCVKALIYYDQAATVLDIDVANDFGDRPLHLAAKWGYYGICQILLDNGASSEACNRKNLTPVDMAHNLKIGHLFVRAEEAARLTNRRHSTPAKMITSVSEQRSEKLNNSADAEISPAHIVMESEDLDNDPKLMIRVNRLLKAVLDADLPLVKFNLGWGSESDSDSSGSPCTPSQDTLCHPLCQCHKCAPLQKLSSPARSGLHVNSQNAEGLSALHVAAQSGLTTLVRLFLQRGAMVNLTSRAHYTPLHLALKNQRTEVVEVLLRQGADVTLADSRLNTPLHLAALYGNRRALTWLLDHGAALNAQNVRGHTALHEAARAGQVTCTRLLVTWGADVTMQNKNGATPIQLSQREEVRHILRQPAHYITATDCATNTGAETGVRRKGAAGNGGAMGGDVVDGCPSTGGGGYNCNECGAPSTSSLSRGGHSDIASSSKYSNVNTEFPSSRSRGALTRSYTHTGCNESASSQFTQGRFTAPNIVPERSDESNEDNLLHGNTHVFSRQSSQDLHDPSEEGAVEKCIHLGTAVTAESEVNSDRRHDSHSPPQQIAASPTQHSSYANPAKLMDIESSISDKPISEAEHIDVWQSPARRKVSETLSDLSFKEEYFGSSGGVTGPISDVSSDLGDRLCAQCRVRLTDSDGEDSCTESEKDLKLH